MSVMRVHKTKNFTVMSNVHFKEKNMSLKAKGLLSLMLSLPDSWDYSIRGLVAICKENETAVKSTLSELKDFGYLSVEKKLPNETDSGRIEYIYNIYEVPYSEQDTLKQGAENLQVESQSVENPTQLNTVPTSTNHLNPLNTCVFNGSVEVEENTPTKKPFDYQRYVDKYHEICKSLPRIYKMTNTRILALKKRVAELGEDEIIRAFKKAEASDFCKGKSDRGWKADIDFILSPTKIVCLLEGKYDNTKSNQPRKTLDEEYPDF